jgi:hypothetical protein
MNIEDTIVLLGGLSILLTFLAIGAGVGDALLRHRENRAQRRRDRENRAQRRRDRVHYVRRMMR